MEQREYAVLYEHEAGHWWFAGLRVLMLDCLRTMGIGQSSLVLDAGCGTGMLLQDVQAQLGSRVIGFDSSHHATEFWPRRGVQAACRASVNEIPFRTGVFDAAVCVDVLECEDAKPVEAYRELCRVVRPGGTIVLVVPAYRWLYSDAHHRAVHAVRRYTRPALRSLLSGGPVTVRRLTHLFPSFLPAIAARRFWERLAASSSPPRSEIGPIPPWLNRACMGLLGMERRLLRFGDLPFGSSILAVVQKQAVGG
jgi:SAM-dependent methyltransferase